jgi:hypothetical protein
MTRRPRRPQTGPPPSWRRAHLWRLWVLSLLRLLRQLRLLSQARAQHGKPLLVAALSRVSWLVIGRPAIAPHSIENTRSISATKEKLPRTIACGRQYHRQPCELEREVLAGECAFSRHAVPGQSGPAHGRDAAARVRCDTHTTHDARSSLARIVGAGYGRATSIELRASKGAPALATSRSRRAYAIPQQRTRCGVACATPADVAG